jgi:hypothetical protein
VNAATVASLVSSELQNSVCVFANHFRIDLVGHMAQLCGHLLTIKCTLVINGINMVGLIYSNQKI